MSTRGFQKNRLDKYGGGWVVGVMSMQFISVFS